MISIKNIFFNTHYWWLIAIILLFIILYNPLKIESSYAWTFDDASAFIGDKLGIYGIFRLTFTYPTYVQTGEQFSGGITIQYIPSPGSHADWVLLNNISIPLINLIDGKIVKNIIDPNSTILRLNDKYSKLFTIRTPFTPGQYLPDFSFNATAPIGGSIHSRSFGIVEAIKQSTVSPNQQIINSSPLILKVLKPISVNNAPSKNLLNRTLLVQINKILPIQMPFANITVRTLNSKMQSITTSNEIQKKFPLNTKLDVTTPSFIPINKGIREKFSGWSDGNTNNPRRITLSKDYELYAMYQIQYS